MLSLKNESLNNWWKNFVDHYEKSAFAGIQQVFELSEEKLCEYYQKFFEAVSNSPQNGTEFFWCEPEFYDSEAQDIYKAFALSRALSVDYTWDEKYADCHLSIFSIHQESHFRPLIGKMSSQLLKALIALLGVNKEVVMDLSNKGWVLEQYNRIALMLLENMQDEELKLSVLKLYDFIPPERFSDCFLRLLVSKTSKSIKMEADRRFQREILKAENQRKGGLASCYLDAVNRSLREQFYGRELLPEQSIDKELFCLQLKFILDNKLVDITRLDRCLSDIEIFFLLLDQTNSRLRRSYVLYLSRKPSVIYQSINNFDRFAVMVKSEFGDDVEVMKGLDSMIHDASKQEREQLQKKIEETKIAKEKRENDPLAKLIERLS